MSWARNGLVEWEQNHPGACYQCRDKKYCDCNFNDDCPEEGEQQLSFSEPSEEVPF